MDLVKLDNKFLTILNLKKYIKRYMEANIRKETFASNMFFCNISFLFLFTKTLKAL